MRALTLLALPLAMSGLTGCFGFGGGGVQPEDYVTSEDYTKWVIEVDYAKGHKPAQSLLDQLRTRLSAVVDKPQGVVFQYGEELPDGGTWDQQKLEDLSGERRDVKTSGNTVSTHLLVLGGESSKDGVLGVAIGWDLVVIFDETIDGATASPGGGCPIPALCDTPRAEVELAVYLHEFGHAIGLVNRGIDMVRDHEDTDHPNHSSNPDSVMYWAVDTKTGLSLLTGGPPTEFDADDRADLAATRRN